MRRLQRESFLAVLLLSFTLSASAQIDTALVGRLEVFVTDTDSGARYEYSLKTAEGSRVRLAFENGRAPDAHAGARFRVRGSARPDGTLLVSDISRVRERAVESNALLPRAESVLVLLGYFPGTTAPCSRATAETIFFANAPALSVKNYYLTSAHGGLTSFTGRVLDPIELTPFAAGSGCRAFEWADYLDDRARAQGIDPANYTRTQYVTPRNGCGGDTGGFAYLNDKRSFVFGCSLGLMGHELGHSFGMHHANANGVEYADPYDIMRGSAHPGTPPELNAPHRIQMNFMPAERIATATASGVYAIGALEIDGLSVPQVLRIRRSSLTDDYIYLSFRTRSGTFDGGLQPPAATHVYRWDGAQTDLRGTLEDNGVFEETGIARVQQLSHSATQATVRIDLGSAPPPPPPPGGCSSGATTLCLRDNRFRVTATFKHAGVTNTARAVPFSNDTGYFWFFNASNTELAVKVLDPLNGRFWVFFGGLTDLEYTIVVTDTATGRSETYLTNAGNLCGGADTDFGTPGIGPRGVPPAVTSGQGPANVSCTADADTLCLQPGGDVIKVETTFSGGVARSGLLPLTLQAGYFTFFNPGNVELITKVLDGRSLNQRYWIFTGALSDVSYTVLYTNTRSGRWVRVQNQSGNYCGSAITHLLY